MIHDSRSFASLNRLISPVLHLLNCWLTFIALFISNLAAVYFLATAAFSCTACAMAG
jgi:hypothetical protein